VWFIQKFGTDVNLGNIATTDVIPLETLRLGLRGDTMPDFHDVKSWNLGQA
jgi:phosphosulfolactate synthase